MLVAMLKNMLPTDGDYRIQFGTHQDENGKCITVQVNDEKQNKVVAVIDITMPK